MSGLGLNSSSSYVLEEQRSTRGAQEFPFGIVIAGDETISQALESSSVAYVYGPVEDQLIPFRTAT